MLKIDEILAELEAEQDRLTQAIEVFSNRKVNREGRMGKRPGSRLSAAARRQISLGMKRRWAQHKKEEKAG